MKKITKIIIMSLVLVMCMFTLVGCGNSGDMLSGADEFDMCLELTNDHLNGNDTSYKIEVAYEVNNDGTIYDIEYTFKMENGNWHIKGYKKLSGVVGSYEEKVDLYYFAEGDFYVGKNSSKKWQAYDMIDSSAEAFIEEFLEVELPGEYDSFTYKSGYYIYTGNPHSYKMAFNDDKLTYLEVSINDTLNNKVVEGKVVAEYSYEATVTIPDYTN